MIAHARSIHSARWADLLFGAAAALFPFAAHANAIWPPAVYFYTVAVWWVVVIGLVVEFIAHRLILRAAPSALAHVVIGSNVASAIAGFVLLWPATFWDRGVEQLARIAPTSFLVVLALIFVLNVAIEYGVSVAWLKVQKSRRALVSFIVANVLSYSLIVLVAMSGILSATET